ncbi:hypothetical protein RJT34_30006 [Clitoria ternatea]|uniref:Uncharacterized protein n=1 Tax=Clitoria ternatea TaxID=43366 RepID=A0AAN9I004_CLITE
MPLSHAEHSSYLNNNNLDSGFGWFFSVAFSVIFLCLSSIGPFIWYPIKHIRSSQDTLKAKEENEVTCPL